MEFSHDFEITSRRRDYVEFLEGQKRRLLSLLKHGKGMHQSVEAEIKDCIAQHPELAGRSEKYRVDDNLGETSLLLLLCAWNASLPLIEIVVSACPLSVRSNDFSTKLVYSLPLHMACYSHASVELIQYLHKCHSEGSAIVDFQNQLPLCYALMHHSDCARLLPILATGPALDSFVTLKWTPLALNSLFNVIQSLVTLFKCEEVSLILLHQGDNIMEIARAEHDGNRILSIKWEAASDNLPQLIKAFSSLSIPVTKVLLQECNASLLEQSLLPKICKLTKLTQVQIMSTTMSSALIRLFWKTMLKLPSLNYIFMYDLYWSNPVHSSDFEDLPLLNNLRRLAIMACHGKSTFIPAVAALLRSKQSHLESLNITANRLDTESMQFLAEALSINTQLKLLYATNIHVSSAPIVKVLSESNCSLVECMLQENSQAEYYTALNKVGRGIVRDSEATKGDLVELLVGLDDIRCIFGLLLEHPALWAS